MNKITQTLIDGFTYNGSALHIIINYAVLFFSVLPHLTAAQKKGRRIFWLVLLISLLVQVALWFIFKGAGISVIWCSLAGYNLLLFRRTKLKTGDRNKTLFLISLFTALAGIIYYAVTLPPITTIAHVVGLLMGIGLFYLFNGHRGN